MNKIIKRLNILLGLALGIASHAQDRPAESLSLINSVTTSNDLYNGTVNVSVPLFEIPVGNLTLSNEISNTPRGFDPKSDESIFGLHWYGNQFGQITRTVSKDFLLTKFFFIDADAFGIYASQNLKTFESTDCIYQTQGLNIGYSKKQILTNPVNLNVTSDYSPDRFYFDFFGYKGYFVFDNKGKALVYCENAKLKVLDSPYTDSKCYSTRSSINFQNKNISEIRMSDDKGNIFYFGGDFNSVEVNYSQYRNSGPWNSYGVQFHYQTLSRANNIISWNLKKVELSNGESIVANYKAGDPTIFNSYLQETLINTTASNGFPTTFPTQAQTNQANVEVSHNRRLLSVYPNFVDFNIYTKRAIIDDIEVVGKNIKIKYNYFKDNNGLVHLSGIDLEHFGKSQNIVFNQVSLGGQNYRYFLESVYKNDEKYYFEYYKTDNLPNKNTQGINGYGYWNGTSTISNNNDVYDFYDVASLKKITYPTLGSTTYKYEAGDTGKSVNSSNTLLQPVIQDSPSDTKFPLLRLLSKIDFDGEKEFTTNYNYKQSNGRSSGIGRYYSQVQEMTTKGLIEYFFSDYSSNPDVNNNRRFNGNNTYMPYSGNRSYERGKLLKKKIFDSSNKLLRQHEYEYHSFLRPESELVDMTSNDCTTCKISDENYYVDVTTFFDAAQNNRMGTSYIPVIPYLLKKEKVTDYFDNNIEISSTTDINYRESGMFWHPYPIRITNNNGGRISVSNIYYPGDVLSTGSCYTSNCTFTNMVNPGRKMLTYKQMVDDNIHFPILTVNKNQSGKYSLSENIYERFGNTNRYRLSSQRSNEMNSLFTESNFESASVFDNMKYEVYDSRGNLIQSRSKTGVPVTTLWGYHQTQPIAKIEGATYAQVMQAFNLDPNNPNSYLQLSIVGKSDLDISDIKESELLVELNSFRTNIGLKDYFVSTYTYDPLIGVKSITPSSGLRESFRYDDSNRLAQVLNGENNILKEYNYNYARIKYFNTAKNESFVRNNCGDDAYGSTVNYTVPANQYMSLISKADADQQAQDDINMNGQNTANMYGTCTSPSYCSFMPENDINGVTSTIERLSDIKVKVQINIPISLNGLNSSNSNLPLQGFFIGEIADGCQLISSSNHLIAFENGRKWMVTMGINGSIFIKLMEGAISPSSTSAGSINLNFEYNINDSNPI